jgi:adenosine/AMP kinase
MEIKSVRLQVPEDSNIIVGQSHFIKTVEDLYEIVVTTVPGAKFAIAFCEASGPCLVRVEANDLELRKLVVDNALAVGAGHTFYILLRQAYPINMLTRIKDCSEVCSIFCATANPLEVIVAQSAQGSGIVGVIDGGSPKGVEDDQDTQKRKSFLRTIGYKL